jgi:CubicO group peptidase (beta-lactamase class C family)
MRKYSIPYALLSLAILIHACRPAADHARGGMPAALREEPPENAGFSAARLSRIDSLFQDFVDQDHIAGATALIARKGRIVYYRATGYDDKKAAVPLQKDAIFRVASQTKGIRLLSRSTVDMMTMNHIGELGSGSLFIPGGTDKFGLGFEVISPPGAARIPIKEGAYGWGGAFGSLYWVDPEEALVAQLVTQKTNNYADVRAKFIAAVYQAIDD